MMLLQTVFFSLWKLRLRWYVTWYCLSWNTLSLVAAFSSVLEGEGGGGREHSELENTPFCLMHGRLFVCQFESDQSASGLPTAFTQLVKF